MKKLDSDFRNPRISSTRLGKKATWSPVSYDIGELVGRLPGAEMESAMCQDAGYNHSLRFEPAVQPLCKKRLNLLNRLRKRIFRLLDLEHSPVDMRFDKFLGIPVDQTLGPAVAQIQIVARKSA